MQFAVVVLWLAAIVGFVPAVVTQRSPYFPLFIYFFMSSDNDDFRLSTFMDDLGYTHIFRPYGDSMSIYAIYKTDDFFYFPDSEALSHFKGASVIPLFIVYDRSTAGFGDGFLIGFADETTGYRNISRLPSNNSVIDLVCEDCIGSPLTGEVITSWDTERNRWVSVMDTAPGTSFAVSTDLKVWDPKEFLPDVDPSILDRAIEAFPIADDDDASKVTWIMIRKSDTDPSALLYYTFVPDDANPEYKEMGVLDASTDCFEFAVINGNSTDYRHRKVVAVKRAEYREFGVPRNIYMSFRYLSFSGGKLRQLPISTVFPTPTYERLFPKVDFLPGDSVFTRLPPSVALAIEAEMKPYPEVDFGFDLFISESSRDDFAIGFTVSPTDKVMWLDRFNWFAAGKIVPDDGYSSLKQNFEPNLSNIYKVMIVVDTCSVEYFVEDGLYVGSIFTFPRSDMQYHDVYAAGPLVISDMKVRVFD